MHELGISLLNTSSPSWGWYFEGKIAHPPYTTYDELLEQPFDDIKDNDKYLNFLEEKCQRVIVAGKQIPHKVTAQLEMARRDINEATTRVVTARDLPTLTHYTNKLLKNGHSDVWWSIADIDDVTDPQGEQSFSPPLFKHVTEDTRAVQIGKLQEYLHRHPDSFVKIFPQDGANPALISMLLTEAVGDHQLTLRIRPGKYTTSERHDAENPVMIDIDFNGEIPVIIMNDRRDKIWIDALLRAIPLFTLLDDIQFTGSHYLQPEFMAYLHDPDGEPDIHFFSDVIWGSKNPEDGNVSCPTVATHLDSLHRARILIRGQDDDRIALIEKRHALQELFHTLQDPSELARLTDSLRQTESACFPTDMLTLFRLSDLLAGIPELPKPLQKIVLLSKAIRELQCAHLKLTDKLARTNAFRADTPLVWIPATNADGSLHLDLDGQMQPTARLSGYTQEETWDPHAIAELCELIMTGAATTITTQILERQLGALTKLSAI